MSELVSSLLRGLIDYAGLFPPAGLDMGSAVAEYARRRASADAVALGRFVVPATRLGELEEQAEDLLPRDGEPPWRLSVLATGEPSMAWAAITTFNQRHASGSPSGHAVADVVELKAATVEEVADLTDAFADFECYVEIPSEPDPTPLLGAITRCGVPVGGGVRDGGGVRAKIRTGGVTADQIPSVAAVARFLVAADRAGVAFKATAGLHHPLRGEYPLTYEAGAASATMHGYLNLFVAAALVRTAALDEPEVRSVLEERDPDAFEIAGDRLRWRERELAAADLDRARADFAVSFGSCSFREPVEELRALKPA